MDDEERTKFKSVTELQHGWKAFYLKDTTGELINLDVPLLGISEQGEIRAIVLDGSSEFVDAESLPWFVGIQRPKEIFAEKLYPNKLYKMTLFFSHKFPSIEVDDINDIVHEKKGNHDLIAERLKEMSS